MTRLAALEHDMEARRFQSPTLELAGLLEGDPSEIRMKFTGKHDMKVPIKPLHLSL